MTNPNYMGQADPEGEVRRAARQSWQTEPHADESTPHRPVLVSIISIVLVIAGAFQVVHGFVMFLDRNDTAYLAETEISSKHATTLAITLMVGGVVRVVLAYGLLNANRWARSLVGIYEIMQIAGGIYTIIVLKLDNAWSAFVSIAAALIVLYFLFATDKTKEYFGR